MYNSRVKIALAQLNPIVGDLQGNARKILAAAAAARKRGAELVVCPELSLTGYPPRDLLELKGFVKKNREMLDKIAESEREIAILMGYVDVDYQIGTRNLYNAAALLYKGKVVARRYKSLLPTYDVFDESRHFTPAVQNEPVLFKGHRLGVNICEDMWHVPELWPETPYHKDPVALLAHQRVDLFINMSCSPYHEGKSKLRRALVQHHVAKHKKPFLFVNQVGGNDELVFDGRSFAVSREGQLQGQAKAFDEDLLLVDTDDQTAIEPEERVDIQDIHDALVLGLRDYTQKCGFKKVLLGLSGGIDSSVTAALAVSALGKQNVLGVLMPSHFSSKGSVTDSLKLAKNLDIQTETLPIAPAFKTFLKTLKPAFHGAKPNVAEENLQARIRGTLLMALSNKFGMLLLTTGNKSELSMGYCTLYGDMNGGLGVISDVLKNTVYRVGRYINRDKKLIPEDCFTKAPSAELRPNQKDQDSLPPYDILDPIVEAYVEDGLDVDEIAAKGYARALVQRILYAIDASEYKRRQAAPGLRLSNKAFGMGRRMPIARKDFR